MKRILQLSLLVLTTNSYAQKLDLGLNGGANWNKALGPFVSARVNLTLKNLMFTGSIDYGNVKAGNIEVPLLDVQTSKLYQAEFESYAFRNYIQPSIAASIKTSLPMSFVYLGGNIGMITGERTQLTQHNIVTVEEEMIRTTTFTVGGQIGSTLNITKNISLNIEGGVRHAFLNRKRQGPGITFFPASVGIRYKL